MELTQSEADALLLLEKVFVNTKNFSLGNIPIDQIHELSSLDGREKFLLDISRGSINLAKYKLQNRARQVYILARVDIGGPPHQNPDGSRIPCPHIHVFREGFDDKWAYPLSNFNFRIPSDLMIVLEDFADYCRIKLPPSQLRYAK